MTRGDISTTAERRFTRPFLALGLAVLSTLPASLAGCATSSKSDEPEPPPGRSALRASRQQLHTAIDRGFRQSESSDSYRVRIRFNPPRCDAPAFEVQAHGRWTRAWLDGPNAIREEIQSYRDDQREKSRGEAVEVTGTFARKRKAETGLSYPVFWVETFRPDS